MNIPRTVIVLAAAALAACQTPATKITADSLDVSTDLYAVNPSDIAVLPVEDATPDQAASAVVDQIRSEISQALVHRLYAPLSSKKVDEALAEAGADKSTVSVTDAGWLKSIAGKCGEDATLSVRITEWDRSSLMSNGRVRFTADVSMMSEKSPNPLWSGLFKGEVKAGGSGPAPMDRAARENSAASELAEALIKRLPRRRA